MTRDSEGLALRAFHLIQHAFATVQDDPVASQGLAALLAHHPDSPMWPAFRPRPVGGDKDVVAAYALSCTMPSGRWCDQNDVSLWNTPTIATVVLEGMRRYQVNPFALVVRNSYLGFFKNCM